jgi:hypothetical protein
MLEGNRNRVQNLTGLEIWMFIIGRVFVAFGIGDPRDGLLSGRRRSSHVAVGSHRLGVAGCCITRNDAEAASHARMTAERKPADIGEK